MEENNIHEQQEQLEELQDSDVISKDKYDELMTELEEVKAKLPVKKSDAELQIEAKQQELWQKEKGLELRSAGLEKFADFFNAQNSEDLKSQVDLFQSLINEMKVDNAYKPSDHRTTDAYTSAKSKGDTLGMIKSLFN
ncbi:hypothetical protein BTR22_05245 [Alkalihalophilus pseudofirmus]|uniref:hypothetical protein n=1 Tax=Alkalihalophilus pseudofirmus TaxID=79885 RepID=UPI0009521467|nr:hypothetical protein BTR22_05245 [Alkalihalophilus pseudofirmus]